MAGSAVEESRAAAERSDAERRALLLSPVGYGVFGALGVGFYLLTRSEAILLDGVYSLVSIALALVALRVSRLVELPDSPRFQFGFGHFEPLINTGRVALILGVDAFALSSAVRALATGGRPLETGPAVVYGVLSAAACLAMAVVQGRNARRIGSALLRVDARNWLVDGMISSAIGVSFLAGHFLAGSRFAGWVDYLDPVLVVALVLGSFPVMLKSLRENLPQVLLAAPRPERQDEVRRRVEDAVAELGPDAVSVRMIEVGRFFYAMVHVVLPEETGRLEVAKCDELRADVLESVGEVYDRPVVDVIFTANADEVLPGSADGEGG